MKIARLPLATFLRSAEVACQTDDIITRPLRCPHPPIPDDGFIRPGNEAWLLADARGRLAHLSVVDVIGQAGQEVRLRYSPDYGFRLQAVHERWTASIGRIDHAFIESSKGTFRRKRRSARRSVSLDDAGAKLEGWRRDSDEVRPRGAFAHMIPVELAIARVGSVRPDPRPPGSFSHATQKPGSGTSRPDEIVQ